MTQSARLFLATTAALLVGTGAAAAQDLQWIGGENPGQVSLIYGLPESDHIKLSLDCDTESYALTLTFLLESEIGVAPPYTLSLANEAGEVTLPAQSVYLEMLDVYLLEVKTTLDETLSAILGNGEWLTVTANDMPGEDILLPTEDELQPLVEACLVVG